MPAKTRSQRLTRIIWRVTTLATAAALLAPAAAPALTQTNTSNNATISKAYAARKRAAAEARRKAAAAARRRRARAAKIRKGGAISRKQVLNRGRSWVKKRVQYSQSRYYKGYRTDCSGFVSMAWKAKSSYTTRSMGAIARRIPNGKLAPGDAVLYPGHVVLFVKWKNPRKGTFVAFEQANSRKDCVKSVRKLKRGKAMRYRKIR